MTLVLDTGALISVDRQDAGLGAILKRAKLKRVPVLTSAAVVAQVWRDGARQANLARTMLGILTESLDEPTGRHIGELLAASRTRDVVDAHVALLVNEGDVVLTSDPDDLCRLLDTRGIRAAIRRV